MALEFALVLPTLLLVAFGMISINLAIYTMSAMQSAAQYAALMGATGQAKSFHGMATQCSGSLSSTQVEYYACQGLPTWATFTVTATENCATPSVSVSLSVNAEAAAVSDIFKILSGTTLTSSAVEMKQGTCP